MLSTERLFITEFTMEMAEDVCRNSQDEDNRRFVPDEVFETVEQARQAICFLMSCYRGKEGPFVYPILLKSGENIGYVQLSALRDGWEIGYHIAKPHTGNGYASEAVRAFLPEIMRRLAIHTVQGVCLVDNTASTIVLERCGFKKQWEGTALYQGRNRAVCSYIYRRKATD